MTSRKASSKKGSLFKKRGGEDEEGRNPFSSPTSTEIPEQEALLLRSRQNHSIQMSPLSPSSPSESSVGRLLRPHSSNTVNESSDMGDASFTLSVRDSSRDLQSISPANPPSSSLRQGDSSDTIEISTAPSTRPCSIQFFCGSKPKRITFIVLGFVSIWGILIFGLNLQKQIASYKKEMDILKDRILTLESKYSLVKDESQKIREENRQIISFIASSKSRRKKPAKPSSSTKPRPESKKTPTPPSEKVCTKSGQKCAFPFAYKGTVYRSCVKEWSYPRAWCATKVDGDRNYISGDSDSWTDCLDYC